MLQIPHNASRIVSILVAGALVLAACGSDTDGESADASPDASAVAADSDTESTETDTDSAAADSTTNESPTDNGATPVSAGSIEDAPVADGTIPTASDYLGTYELADEAFGTMVTVTVDGGSRVIETNALPDHETGDFPNAGNPNVITAQDLTWTFPTEPVYTGGAVNARTPGVAINGVKFEPATAETVTCESGETFRIEAIQELLDLGLDFNNAHVQPTGEYHYHGISELLVDAYATDDDLVLIGFMADGYLAYYSKSGAYESSYALDTDARTGSGCVASGPDSLSVEVEGTNPDGTFNSDWVYTAGSGDLDECNGAVIDGTYAYIVTDTYPYISRCLNGEPSADAGAGGPGGGGEAPGGAAPGGAGEGAAPAGGAGGAPPDLTAAAEALGVSVEELQAALGGPPPDFGAAAEILGVSVEELEAVVPAPPNG
ncbi:MAG: YHYH protein [Actinomycetota bacterium]